MKTKRPQINSISLHIFVALTVLMATLPVKAQMTSQKYAIPASTMNSGGGRQGSNHYEIRNSMGQPMPPGVARSDNFGLFAGFQSCLLDKYVPAYGQRGDVDNDGSTNILDVLAVVNHILGIIPLTGDALARADCNGDGIVNILDALGIVNVILGITPECPGSAAKIEVHPEAMRFLESLQPYFSPEDFVRLMAMVKEVQMPESFELAQNYPNPFNPTTAISYQLSAISSPVHTTLKVYNVLGQEVRTLVDQVQEPGYYTVRWDASEMASGVYFYRLTAGDFSATKTMALIR